MFLKILYRTNVFRNPDPSQLKGCLVSNIKVLLEIVALDREYMFLIAVINLKMAISRIHPPSLDLNDEFSAESDRDCIIKIINIIFWEAVILKKMRTNFQNKIF